MKFSFVVLLCIVCHSDAQLPGVAFSKNGVYTTADDFLNHTLTNAFETGKTVTFLKNKRSCICIKTADSITRFYYDQIWGFRENGTDYRVLNGSEYKVEYTDCICLYTLPVCVACLTTAPYYFSVSVSSPVHPLSRKNLLDSYHANTRFIAKLTEMRWITSIMKLDKRTHMFRFIGWL